MKIILIGANGTIGEQVQKALAGAGDEIVKVGRKSGEFPSRDREPRKCQEALSSRRLV
jgi:nucleoside-diphosphate-sugar epimerase